MNLAAENFSLHDIFIYGFTLKSKPPCGMELAAKKIYTENSCLTRAVGKNLTVSSVNFTRRQPLLRVAKPRAEHPGTGLFRGNNENKLGGGGGCAVGKIKIFKQHDNAGYCCSGVEVSFLPEFIGTFITSRHGVSPVELEKIVTGLCARPFIPEAVIILDQIENAAFRDGSDRIDEIDGIKDMWIEAKSMELFSVILNWHRGRKALPRPPLNGHDRPGITRALRYAEEHISEPLALRDLAKQAYMSKSKFTSVFKNHTGFSAAEYIRHLRMEKALKLVKNTNIPLGEIAALVGYKKHSNFSRVFKTRYGVTPETLRKKR